ncbi:hypothetical protein M413DRAFT_250232 [Hebeloma cylindrosporum]|uniref:Uncharacterized protein n=1 Tax=Hebeloma cylindrosporum TaxID=76867 RepID=A0A0C2XJV2_HEBCY|nr:hypothetical protein M413DRAFT_250232 [Hebeloma cylindrosporum h7]
MKRKASSLGIARIFQDLEAFLGQWSWPHPMISLNSSAFERNDCRTPDSSLLPHGRNSTVLWSMLGVLSVIWNVVRVQSCNAIYRLLTLRTLAACRQAGECSAIDNRY